MNKETKNKGEFSLKTVLFCSLTNALAAALLALFAAILIIKSVLSQSYVPILVPVITVLATFGSIWFWQKQIREGKLLFALVSGAVYFGITLLVKLAAFPGEALMMGLNAILIGCSALLAGILGGLRKKPSVRRR